MNENPSQPTISDILLSVLILPFVPLDIEGLHCAGGLTLFSCFLVLLEKRALAWRLAYTHFKTAVFSPSELPVAAFQHHTGNGRPKSVPPFISLPH